MSYALLEEKSTSPSEDVATEINELRSGFKQLEQKLERLRSQVDRESYLLACRLARLEAASTIIQAGDRS